MEQNSVKSLPDQAREICDTLCSVDDDLARELVNRISDKWSLWTLDTLASAKAPLRFSRLVERVEGISQKSLTKTLRQLERDGLVTRKMFMEVPPRVEYAVTPLGLELLEHVTPLWIWVAQSLSAFRLARVIFDTRATPKPAAAPTLEADETTDTPTPPPPPRSAWNPRKWIA